MIRAVLITCFAALAIAGCSTTEPPAPEVVRQDAAPRPTLTSAMIGGVGVRTLADGMTAEAIAAQAGDEAAASFEADNKGNACFRGPRLVGVGGGVLSGDGERREEFWTYEVCGETYEVPVVVTKQQSPGTVAFTVGTGREAR